MMVVVKKIELPQWATESTVRAVMNALQNQFTGQGPAALFVGGCVRNTLAGESVDDIDIATPLVPADVMRAASAAGIKIALTGVEHGTLTLIVDRTPFQVTTLREDVETDGRHARVAFSQDWLADAKRRDFTINTLLMDLDGQIYDPLGQGLGDLAAGQVRFVGNADTRIQEDYVRILRFFRFYGRYGKGQPDAQALAACRTNAGGMAQLSAERVRDELKKILIAQNAPSTITLIQKNNILNDVVHVKNKEYFERFCDYQNQMQQASVIESFLFVCGLDMAAFKALSEKLKFSRADTITGLMVLNAMTELSDVGEQALKKLIYYYDYKIASSAALIKLSEGAGDADLSTLKALQSWPVPECPITGDDLMALGMAEGAKLGQVLKDIEQRWVDSDFMLTRNNLIECAQDSYKP